MIRLYHDFSFRLPTRSTRCSFTTSGTELRSLAAFVDATRGKPSVGTDLSDGLESLAVVLAAEQAACMGQKVAVTTAVEDP